MASSNIDLIFNLQRVFVFGEQQRAVLLEQQRESGCIPLGSQEGESLVDVEAGRVDERLVADVEGLEGVGGELDGLAVVGDEVHVVVAVGDDLFECGFVDLEGRWRSGLRTACRRSRAFPRSRR